MEGTPRIFELKGADPEAAFREAQAEARHTFGHSGATGTLADVDGCIVVSGPALLGWDCRRVAQQMLRDGHARPGGPVFILRLADPVKTRTVKSLIDITGLGLGQADDLIDSTIREKIDAESQGIVRVELRDEDAEGPGRKGQRKVKVKLTQTPGPRSSKFSVRHTASNRELVSLESIGDAKAWMREALEKGAAPMHLVVEQWKGDEPWLRGEAEVVKHTVYATATVGEPANAEGNGTYLMAGMLPVPQK